jgi:UDP-N-acetyl-D-galactosamine dehydrogenase
MLSITDLKIAVIGLGYVGLPLAVEFGKKVPVVGLGFTKNGLINRKVIDNTLEVILGELK